MKSVSVCLLIVGAALLGISACRTVPKAPLVPGELRLLGLLVPEKDKIRPDLPFVVNIRFQAEDSPEIRSACFYFAGDGPHCFKVTDVDYGLPGTIKVQVQTKNSGSRLLECYVLYLRDGKIQSTNRVSTYYRPVPR